MSTRPVFDPDLSWAALERRMETETDPRRKALVSQVRDHMRSEIGGQLDALMATLIDEPQYHMRGLGIDIGPKGRENVHSFYKNMIDSGAHRFMFDIQRIVVDDDCVVTEGFMRSATTGAALLENGVSEVDGEAVDPNAGYVSENLILTVWPADADGRLVGEDIWFGSQPNSKVSKL